MAQTVTPLSVDAQNIRIVAKSVIRIPKSPHRVVIFIKDRGIDAGGIVERSDSLTGSESSTIESNLT